MYIIIDILNSQSYNEFMTQDQYRDYLRYIYLKTDGTPLSESSVKHYANEAMRLINEKLKLSYGPQFSIYDINDIEELKRCRDYLFNQPDFTELDNRGNRMYSAGMNRYFEFAEGCLFRGKKELLTTFDKPMIAKEGINRTVYTPDRNRILIIQAEQAYNYTCQRDPSHKTFIVDRTSHQYMEGHHIIPLKEQSNFKYSLDCFANILVLCPTCHRFFHYGEKAQRDNELFKLYDERAERLANAGIIIDRKDFIETVDRVTPTTYYSY